MKSYTDLMFLAAMAGNKKAVNDLTLELIDEIAARVKSVIYSYPPQDLGLAVGALVCVAQICYGALDAKSQKAADALIADYASDIADAVAAVNKREEGRR